MAARYFIAGGVDSNWSTIGNWSLTSGGAGGLAVPTAADDVFFDSVSPACTVNTSARVALSLTFTGYTNTITMTFQISVSGSVTLVSAMTIAGTGALLVIATGSITSGGKVWPNAMTFTGTSTISLLDAWVVSGLLTLGTATQTTTINSANVLHTLTAQAGMTIGGTTPTIAGTTKLLLDGTGTLTQGTGGTHRLDTDFKSGTITISPTNPFRYNTGELTNTGATVVTTGSTLTCILGTTIDCPNISWNIVSLTGTSTFTLTNKLVSAGLLTIGSTTVAITINGIIEASGGVTFGGTTNSVAGTSDIKLLATQTVTKSSTGTFSKPILINVPGGTITFSGNCEFALGLIAITACGGIITDAGTWPTFGSAGVQTARGMAGGMRS